MDSSDVGPIASGAAEAGISGDGMESGPRTPALHQSWRSHDLTPGHAYDSIHFGVVYYEGIDAFYGQNTHKFKGNMPGLVRYVQADKLDEFLKPKAAIAHPSWEKIHQPFSARFDLGIPKSDWLYPVWDRESAVWLMRQADEVVGEVYQSLRNDSWGDIKWHCKTSDERGLEKTHTLAEAKCEASFWKYEWMKASGRAPK